ncbi:MAG: hypothetical protein K0Q76_3649 [Panacagrimonas sp.]|jgi:uncharacterized protein YfaS (alpha-2-macroglobulin family)|nr:alpha-2-macroglobulin [Panacagrimonas sp.]MCC2658541.1 hypothetical protein [Panacagrimonas sp.]
MSGLERLLAAVGRGLRTVWGLVAALFATLFGSIDWYAPDWLRFLGQRMRRAGQALRNGMRAHPARSAGIAALLLALIGGGFGAWRWYQAQPKPELVTFEVGAPARTCYECDPPGSPQPLRVRFSASVAPIEASGKPLDPAKRLVNLSPAHPGRWQWLDDRTLSFDPGEDWPVGQVFDVEFDAKRFVASHQRLDRYEFEFTAPAFEVKVRNTEFHQDPMVATDKKAVLTLGFSHAVDTADLERRISLHLYDKVADGKEEDLGEVAYRISYDDKKLEAYVASEHLKVPAKEGRLEFKIEPGVRSARGGNTSPEILTSQVKVPGINSLAVNELKLDLARDLADDPQQVAVLEFNFPVPEKDTPARLKAWLLPARHPDAETQKRFEESAGRGVPYDWGGGVDNRILEKSQPIKLEVVAGERDNSELQSFRYTADPGRYVYVRLDKGLTAFGGYRLGETQQRVLRVPEYPRELRVVASGSLLAMSGPKLLNVLSRDVPAMKVEVSRLLPKQLQHLVSQTQGEFSTPAFKGYSLDGDNLTERFTKTEILPKVAAGKPGYTTLDLGAYLKDGDDDRRGIFLLKLQGWDDQNKRAITTPQPNEWGDMNDSPVVDSRLVVVTDLGIVVKRNLDGSSDVFVQSIHTGEPVAGVSVEIIGRNGLAVLDRETDGDGHVRFPTLKDFKREQQPVMVLARKGGDTSFLPLDYRLRELDLSRFDVGGVGNSADRTALSAYLFSDRGVYRPGEEIRLGAIVRTQDWSALPKGLPLLLEVTDPRGQLVRKERMPLSAAGFEEIRHATKAASPTGTWTFSLSIVKDKYRNELVGSVTVLVREFEPDRLKMAVTLSQQRALGWVSPDKLAARIDLQNLFGAPAQDRRVTATLRLTPRMPEFAPFRDYAFHDPQAAKEGFSEELPETKTDDKGGASLDLNLDRFARATYRVQVVAQGFEAEGGRGVAGEVTQLVSNMPFLVGVKPDGDLSYVGRNAQRSAHLIAVDPTLTKIAAKDLGLRRLEIKYVSTLVKQRNGTFKYESRRREATLDEQALEIAAAGNTLPLDASTPGSFAYLVVDKSGQQLARLDYTVAGEANLSARMEKNAELQLALSKKDYAPGEEIEIQVNAPYTGAGLITIERDRVYAWKWFSAATTASTQRITLPEGIEGNAYVSVAFVRDPGSPEIYASPLSHGVAPFSINLDARRSKVEITMPAKVKPGETASFRYKVDRPSKLLLFAVDEGILQVARYVTPDPLGFLFQKRSLDVGTLQILDLILPEFRAALMQAAPGGDADGLLAQHLNPFKRKNDAPVAFWSGIVEADEQERTLEYVVPDHFNGKLRVIAVAVADGAIGLYEGATLVRGDFILSPNAPTFVAPGDTFEVSLGVSNQAEGSGPDAKLSLKLVAGKGLELAGPGETSLALAEGRESSVRFKLKATEDLGDGRLSFTSTLGDKSAKRSVSLSVRPATPFRTQIDAAVVKPGSKLDVPASRQLFPQFREQEAGISMLPMALANGFVSYLGNYPYSCTEQLVSQAMPALVLGKRPEFGRVESYAKADFNGLVAELRARQNPDGAFRYWPGSFETHEFVSVYVQHVLIEARERGRTVPKDLLDQGNEYLRALSSRDGDTLEQERNGAYAMYLLTRQGQTQGAEASRLRGRLESRYAKQWHGDIAAGYLAAAMKLMKQDREADALFARIELVGKRPVDRWHDDMTADAELLYLTARHFPQRLTKLPDGFVDALVARIAQRRYHSLSAATTLLALDAYADIAGPQGEGKLALAQVLADGTAKDLPLPVGLFPKVDFDAKTAKLRFGNEAPLPAYASVSQVGFDRVPPKDVLREGFEILREYVDADGKAVTRVEQGEEVTVRLKFRAIDKRSSWNVALVDLFPGGFELVVPPTQAQTQMGQASTGSEEEAASSSGEGGEEEYEGEPGDGNIDTPTWGCPVCREGTQSTMLYADFREDRNVFYVGVTPELSQIVYRIKATNTGTFTVPPAYGEGMYDRDFNARSAAASITVEKPE